MSNINDYLLWRGDLSFAKDEFNEIDSMILARFSYLPFNKINMEKEETVESIAEKLNKFKDEEFGYHGDKDMITRMGKSNRFKNLKVTDYEENIDKDVERQFSAITIHLPDKSIYISFCGTDNTIVGWKEDFNLSFMEHIPAQISGVEYTKKIASKYPFLKIRMGGHSKGGNVAIYSAIYSETRIKNRIIGVSNYDGPGFDKKITETDNYKSILNKLYTYIPQSSVVGRLLEHEEKHTIVESIEKGLYQHDIFSWQVLGTELVKLDEVTSDSEFINKTIRTWLKETNPEQRKIFIDTAYQIFDSTNAVTLKELTSSKMKNLNTIFKAYSNMTESDKKMMTNMIKEFVNAVKEIIIETAKEQNIKK